MLITGGSLVAGSDNPHFGTMMPLGSSTPSEMGGPDFQGTYPTIIPEFFGDMLLVNGMAWPKRDVQPTQYRLNLLARIMHGGCRFCAIN
jgi:FtsP/CotA-like multicopper oxidase with cupredoxin domain